MKWINEKTVQGEPNDIEVGKANSIVRCKDCKYWAENKTTKGSYRNCIFSKTMMNADDFCSRGERKDG